MIKDFYNSLYRYIRINYQLKRKPKMLNDNNEKFTDEKNWEITKSNIKFKKIG